MAHSADTGGPPDTEQLHDLAMSAETNLEQLATGIGQLGADPGAVEAVTKMADVVRKIASGLAKGLKAEPAEPPHTMATATDAMMAPAGPPA